MKETETKIVFNWGNILRVFISVSAIVAFVIIISFLYSKLNISKGSKLPKEKITVEDNNNKDLKIEDISVGTGKEAKEGNKVTVNYIGTLLNGQKFDSSYDRNEPFTFILGNGEVIAGWDKGLIGMKEGGKRKLTIPPDLAYGEAGAGNTIPPNSTLVFEIELLKVEN